MPLSTLLPLLHPVDDVYEESLFLFSAVSSNPASNRNLGFLSRTASTLTVPIRTPGASLSTEYTIHQSPTLLNASLSGGTTGAVLWRITPLLAGWFAAPPPPPPRKKGTAKHLVKRSVNGREREATGAIKENPFFEHGILGSESTVLELGSGVSGVLAVTLGQRVRKYWASDQEYVLKLLRRNVTENLAGVSSPKKGSQPPPDVDVIAVDWEETDLASHPAFPREREGGGEKINAVVAADCIYNEALVAPFVETCVDACRLHRSSPPSDHGRGFEDAVDDATVVIVAQELRASDVFEAWLEAFMQRFRTWRVPEGLLGSELGPREGFAVHVGVLREHLPEEQAG